RFSFIFWRSCSRTGLLGFSFGLMAWAWALLGLGESGFSRRRNARTIRPRIVTPWCLRKLRYRLLFFPHPLQIRDRTSPLRPLTTATTRSGEVARLDRLRDMALLCASMLKKVCVHKTTTAHCNETRTHLDP